MIWNKSLQEYEELNLIIKKFNLDKKSLNISAFYQKINDLEANNLLSLILTDNLHNIELPISKLEDNRIVYNYGKEHIDEDFSDYFIDFIEEYCLD